MGRMFFFKLFQDTLLMSWKLSSPSQEDNPSTATIKKLNRLISCFIGRLLAARHLIQRNKKIGDTRTRYKAQFNDSRQLYLIRGIYGKVKTLINRVASRMKSPLYK